MGGLLHDVGKLVLDTNMPAEYKHVVEMVKNENRLLIEAEHEVFDTDHTEVGAWMAERWQLPSELVQSIGYHHSLEFASLPHARIVAIVHAASICAEAAELMDAGTTDELQVSIPLEIESALGLSQKQFMDIVQDLHNRKAEIQLLFR